MTTSAEKDLTNGAAAAPAPGSPTPTTVPHAWWGLAVLALPTLLVALDLGVLLLALPRIAADLDASTTQLLWLSDIYGFVVAGLLVTMGSLADRVGLRKLVLIGGAGFGLVSLLAAASSSAGMLIAARGLLGVAGATLMPCTLALIHALFPDSRRRANALSWWAACVMVGVAAGPLLGGVLVTAFGWRSVFLIGVPVAGLLLAAGPRLLPEPHRATRRRLDAVSVALLLTALLSAVYGLKGLAADEAPSPLVPAVALIVGLTTAVVFVRRQRDLPYPLLDLELLAESRVGAAMIAMIAGALASGGAAFLFTQHLQLVVGLEPLHAGYWTVPYVTAMAAGSLLTPILARRLPAGPLLAGGLATAAAGLMLLSRAHADMSLVWPTAGMVLIYLGVAPTWVLGTDVVLAAAPSDKTGAAAALSETGSEIGVALGVAVLGSIASLGYRLALPPTPTGRDTDTLVALVEDAAVHPSSDHQLLLDTARAAFHTGLTAATISTALALLTAAVFTAHRLRRRPKCS